MATHNWPAKGGGGSAYWGDAVASFAALPPSGAVVGEVRLVLDTDELYEWNGTTWQKVPAPGVSGPTPATSTDNAIARWDGATGRLLQNSGVTINDSNQMAGASISADTNTVADLEVDNLKTGVLDTDLSAVAATDTTIPSAKAVKTYVDAGDTALQSDIDDVASDLADEITRAITAEGVLQADIDTRVERNGDTMLGFLTLSADPSSSLHAATKQYVDALANGVRWKSPVRVATTANVNLSTELENGDTIDAVVLVTNDRVLVKNQSSASQNGIYVVQASGAAVRAPDADAFAELNGACAFVDEGTANGNKGFFQNATLTSLSDNQVWVQNFGTGLYTADGNALQLSGSTFGVVLDGATLSQSASGLKVATGGINNNEIGASAAIARSKIATGTANRLVYNLTGTGVMSDLAAITASKALVSDANGLPVAATATTTEVNYLAGVNALIQTQLDAKLAATQVLAINSNVTLTNKAIHFVDTSSARSLTLPAPAVGLYIVIKDKTGSAQTNNITLVRNAAENIETVAASFVLDMDLGSWTIVSDGTDYFII